MISNIAILNPQSALLIFSKYHYISTFDQSLLDSTEHLFLDTQTANVSFNIHHCGSDQLNSLSPSVITIFLLLFVFLLFFLSVANYTYSLLLTPLISNVNSIVTFSYIQYFDLDKCIYTGSKYFVGLLVMDIN